MSKQIIASTGNINTEIVDKSNANFTELYTLVESTGDLLFDKPFGRRYGTWDTPVTGDLVIDDTGAQDGYCVVVVWSGDTNPNVTGGVRGCVSGAIDEQAIYNIYFNRIDGRYNVNILKQSTATATAPTITATQDIDSVITVTNPSIVTNDTLLGYNNYSDIDGQLGTMMTPTEATNGHTVVLSDDVVHEVTTKPVGTTNGEFTESVSNAVTVDLNVTYGLRTILANADRFYSTTDILWNDGVYVEFRVNGTPTSQSGFFIGNGINTSTNGSVNLRPTTLDIRLEIGDSEGKKTGANVDYADQDLIRIERSGDDFLLKLNGATQDTLTTVGFVPEAAPMIFGAWKVDGSSASSMGFSEFVIDGETWSFSEQTGSTATGSGGTVLTLATTGGTVNDMWISV